jgi:hypothetical protein
MGEDPGSRLPSGAGDNDATHPFVARDQVTGPQQGSRRAAPPTRPPAGVAPLTRPPASPSPDSASPDSAAPPTRLPDSAAPLTRPPGEVAGSGDPGGIVRHGPGVPVVPPPSQAALTAETVWRTGRLPESSRRPIRVRRLLSAAVSIILLAASAVIFYLRFHHAPFHVTGVAITQQAHAACRVNVTGRISTNGSAGTVSYQWLNQPGGIALQPLRQSVSSGQKAINVTVAIQGQGHGTTSETVTLQVLGPDAKSASTGVVISCL